VPDLINFSIFIAILRFSDILVLVIYRPDVRRPVRYDGIRRPYEGAILPAFDWRVTGQSATVDLDEEHPMPFIISCGAVA
jgi:hypothetical protein